MSRLDVLTAREPEVLALLAPGFTERGISAASSRFTGTALERSDFAAMRAAPSPRADQRRQQRA
jgi:hypothetical protein